MKKFLLLVLLAPVLFLGCNFFTRDFYSPGDSGDPTKGSVILILNGDSIPTKTIAPNVDMDVDYYDAKLYAPGATPGTDNPINSQIIVVPVSNITLGMYEFTGLEQANGYSVTVEAFNYGINTVYGGGDDVLIGAIDGDITDPLAQAFFNITAGLSTPLLVDVYPIDGLGDLKLTITWPDEVGAYEELTTTLGGLDIPYTDSRWTTSDTYVEGEETRQIRVFEEDNRGEGYYTLVLQLYEWDSTHTIQGNLLWGWVEAVRIIAVPTEDVLTEGVFNLTSLNGGAGAVGLKAFMQVEISFTATDIVDGPTPLTINEAGDYPIIAASFPSSDGLIVTALTDPADPGSGAYEYSWYLNGTELTEDVAGVVSGVGTSVLTLNENSTLLTSQTHNLSLIVKTSPGTAYETLSSNTIIFTVD